MSDHLNSITFELIYISNICKLADLQPRITLIIPEFCIQADGHTKRILLKYHKYWLKYRSTVAFSGCIHELDTRHANCQHNRWESEHNASWMTDSERHKVLIDIVPRDALSDDSDGCSSSDNGMLMKINVFLL